MRLQFIFINKRICVLYSGDLAVYIITYILFNLNVSYHPITLFELLLKKKNRLTDTYMFLNNMVFIKYFVEEMEERVQISCHTAINLVKAMLDTEQPGCSDVRMQYTKAHCGGDEWGSKSRSCFSHQAEPS